MPLVVLCSVRNVLVNERNEHKNGSIELLESLHASGVKVCLVEVAPEQDLRNLFPSHAHAIAHFFGDDKFNGAKPRYAAIRARLQTAIQDFNLSNVVFITTPALADNTTAFTQIVVPSVDSDDILPQLTQYLHNVRTAVVNQNYATWKDYATANPMLWAHQRVQQDTTAVSSNTAVLDPASGAPQPSPQSLPQVSSFTSNSSSTSSGFPHTGSSGSMHVDPTQGGTAQQSTQNPQWHPNDPNPTQINQPFSHHGPSPHQFVHSTQGGPQGGSQQFNQHTPQVPHATQGGPQGGSQQFYDVHGVTQQNTNYASPPPPHSGPPQATHGGFPHSGIPQNDGQYGQPYGNGGSGNFNGPPPPFVNPQMQNMPTGMGGVQPGPGGQPPNIPQFLPSSYYEPGGYQSQQYPQQPPPPPQPVDPHQEFIANCKGKKPYVVFIEVSGVLAHVTDAGAEYGGSTDPSIIHIQVKDGTQKQYDVRIRPGAAEIFKLARLGFVAIWSTLPRAVVTAVLGALRVNTARDVAFLFTGDDALAADQVNDPEAKKWIVEGPGGVKNYYFPGLLRKCHVDYKPNSWTPTYAGPFPFSLQKTNCVLLSTRHTPNFDTHTITIKRWSGQLRDNSLNLKYRYFTKMLAQAHILGALQPSGDIIGFFTSCPNHDDANIVDNCPGPYHTEPTPPPEGSQYHIGGAMHTMCVSSHYLTSYLNTPRDVGDFGLQKIAEAVNEFLAAMQDEFGMSPPPGYQNPNPVNAQGVKFLQELYNAASWVNTVSGWWRNLVKIHVCGKDIPFNRLAGLALRHDNFRAMRPLSYLIRAANMAVVNATELQRDVKIFYFTWADETSNYFMTQGDVRIPAAIVGNTDVYAAQQIAANLQPMFGSIWFPASQGARPAAYMFEIDVPAKIIHGCTLEADQYAMPTEVFIAPYSFYKVHKTQFDPQFNAMRVHMRAYEDNLGHSEVPCAFWC